jgi:hypothetical protein
MKMSFVFLVNHYSVTKPAFSVSERTPKFSTDVLLLNALDNFQTFETEADVTLIWFPQ